MESVAAMHRAELGVSLSCDTARWKAIPMLRILSLRDVESSLYRVGCRAAAPREASAVRDGRCRN